MSQIILYSGENLSGANDIITSDASYFGTISSVKSLRVEGGIWVVFSEANYMGDFAVYQKGDYKSALKINKIRSIRELSGTLQNHVIKVYEQTKYSGQEHIIKDPENRNLTHSAMSHKVESGVWILYDGYGYTGNKIVSIAGDHVPEEAAVGLNGQVKSLKAYLTYEPKN
ncbi:epidermal differentiation-specific protein-like [Leptodactylus fuscus]|uniref:epidermal differentiation-specific protein-like n=1 Tax=Leptodactylus fuscus TaxID=238119 RepID=UPI003F4ED634